MATKTQGNASIVELFRVALSDKVQFVAHFSLPIISNTNGVIFSVLETIQHAREDTATCPALANYLKVSVEKWSKINSTAFVADEDITILSALEDIHHRATAVTLATHHNEFVSAVTIQVNSANLQGLWKLFPALHKLIPRRKLSSKSFG